jgi:hypothetical protein
MTTAHRPARRSVLKGAAGLAAGSGLSVAARPGQAEAPPARPGEFDFLSGAWKIAHRRLKAPGDWDEF